MSKKNILINSQDLQSLIEHAVRQNIKRINEGGPDYPSIIADYEKKGLPIPDELLQQMLNAVQGGEPEGQEPLNKQKGFKIKGTNGTTFNSIRELARELGVQDRSIGRSMKATGFFGKNGVTYYIASENGEIISDTNSIDSILKSLYPDDDDVIKTGTGSGVKAHKKKHNAEDDNRPVDINQFRLHILNDYVNFNWGDIIDTTKFPFDVQYGAKDDTRDLHRISKGDSNWIENNKKRTQKSTLWFWCNISLDEKSVPPRVVLTNLCPNCAVLPKSCQPDGKPERRPYNCNAILTIDLGTLRSSSDVIDGQSVIDAVPMQAKFQNPNKYKDRLSIGEVAAHFANKFVAEFNQKYGDLSSVKSEQ